MKSKSFLYSMAAIVAMGLATSSCSNDMDEPMSLQTRAVMAGTGSMTFEAAQKAGYGAVKFDLVEGKKLNDYGDIYVWNDNENVYVKYALADGRTMNESHLYIGFISLDDFKAQYANKNGNMNWGHLPYNETFTGGVSEYTYTFSIENLKAELGDVSEETDLCPSIAAHAAGNGWSITGKGNDNTIQLGKNWFTIIGGEEYCIEFPEEEEEPGDEDKEYTWSIEDAQTATVANKDDHKSMNFKSNNDHFAYIDLSNVTEYPYEADIVQGNGMNVIGTIQIKKDESDNNKLIIDFSNMWFTEDTEVTMEDNSKGAIDPNKSFIIAGFDESPAGKYKNQGSIKGRETISAAQTITVDKKNFYYIHVDAGKLVVTEVSEATE